MAVENLLIGTLVGFLLLLALLTPSLDGGLTVSVLEVYFTGLVLGFAYAAPIGAQNMFVIRTAASERLKPSLITALFVALNDVGLAAFCFFGIGSLFVKNAIIKQIMIGCGAAILAKLAYSTFREAAKQGKADIVTASDQSKTRFSFIAAAVTATSLTWLNPQAILDGTLLLGGYRAAYTDLTLASWFLLGVCTASFCWFFALTSTVAFTARRGGGTYLRALSFASAAMLAFLSVKMAGQLIDSAKADPVTEPRRMRVAIMDNLKSEKLASEG